MKIILSCILIFSCSVFNLFAQTSAISTVRTPKAMMDKFMDKRFGMFIHFGPVSLRGTEIGWSRNAQVPASDYDSLYKEFNPVLFNADAWVKTAKDAGMKYLTITSKHHDGFCLWPTAYSSYNIMNSPYKHDIVGELATACKKQGVAFCIYFTVLDWHDADYPIHSPHDTLHNVPGNMPVFVQRMKNELREIITKYKPEMLWFDGYWESPWTSAYGKEIYSFIKSIDVNVVVNNRLGKASSGVDAVGESLQNADAVGDYLTPEQTIGEMNMNEPWESCFTICNQWAWKPNDPMKSLKQCIQTLVRTAGGNGNLLFNVGPMMDGRIEARQVARLQQMGAWLKLNGESIYGTKGGPYMPNDVYAATRKGNKLYLHIFDGKSGNIMLPALPDVSIIKAHLLNGSAVPFTQNNKQINITLPGIMPDENATVIVLELNKDAEEIPVIKN